MSLEAIEIRDPERARLFVAQGLCAQRVAPPSPSAARRALEWSLELAGMGEGLFPPGTVGDIGHLVFGNDEYEAHASATPGIPPELIRRYEDYVLGKIDADSSFVRASDAIRHAKERDRARGLAFALHQFRDRAGYGGLRFTPAAIKSALGRPIEEILALGWESLGTDGPLPELVRAYEDLVLSVRNAPEFLGPEDIFELESGTAVAQFGQRLALRQVLHSAESLKERLRNVRLRPSARRQSVATRILEEDAYPVGGFSSISTKGSMESLLHSQLAYMEPNLRPDMFDIKYARDELLYYSRDENQFFRHRRAFIFDFQPDLAQARLKDRELPVQRVILVLGLVVALIQTLTDLLTEDALAFDLFFPQDDRDPLRDERELMKLILREPIANGTVRIEQARPPQVIAHCERVAPRARCEYLSLSLRDRPQRHDQFRTGWLAVPSPVPDLGFSDQPLIELEGDIALDRWREAFVTLVASWL